MSEKVRVYRGVFIHPMTRNSMGLRWWAYGSQRMLRADTLSGMRELIRRDLGVRQS